MQFSNAQAFRWFRDRQGTDRTSRILDEVVAHKATMVRSVLDIGAFDCTLLIQLRSRLDGTELDRIEAIEPDFSQIASRDSIPPGIKLIESEFDQFVASRKPNSQRFDLVMGIHVLYHLEFNRTLQNVANMLSDEGVAVFVTDTRNAPVYKFLVDCVDPLFETRHLRYGDHVFGENINSTGLATEAGVLESWVEIRTPTDLARLCAFIGRYELESVTNCMDVISESFRCQFGCFPVKLPWKELVHVVSSS